jgi:hypothetical protein
VPADPVTLVPLGLLGLVAGALVIAGMAGFRGRDLAPA